MVGKECLEEIEEGNEVYLPISDDRYLRSEAGFAPFLIAAPLIFGFFLLRMWVIFGLYTGDPAYFLYLPLGLTIIICNICFEILFIREYFRDKNRNKKRKL
jgi:hypothetical protein